jgi:hypothetical protein
MIIDIATRKAARASRSATSATPPFLGQPVISSRRCPSCGTPLLGFPRWRETTREDCNRATADGGGWIEFDEACAYGCEPG